jgi:hypothetical protein
VRPGLRAYADAARPNDLRLLLSHTLGAPSRLSKSFVGTAAMVLVLSHRILWPLQDFTTKSSPASSIATSSHDCNPGGWELAGTRGDSLDMCCPSSFLTFGIPSLTCRCVHGCNRSSSVSSLLPSRFVCCLLCPSQFSFPTWMLFPLPSELSHLITLLEMD